MRWGLYRWAWLLESPLAVGAPPAGSLNRCRLYVPARTLWGALTAERARAKAGAKQPRYDDVGRALREKTRLTYLFPAESVDGGWLAWLPRYEEARGLVWRREDDAARPLCERRLRQRLLATRASTAIDPRSDAAAEGSLREIECVADRWRGSRVRVAIIGYVFVQDGTDLGAEDSVIPAKGSVIHVGGDTRYGLGRLRCVECVEATAVFGRKVEREGDDPSISSCAVLAHAFAEDDACAERRGALELLSGWSRDRLGPSGDGQPLWAPGSCWRQKRSWKILPEGIWSLATPSA